MSNPNSRNTNLNPQCLMNNILNTIEKIFWKKKTKTYQIPERNSHKCPRVDMSHRPFMTSRYNVQRFIFGSPSAEPQVPAYWINELPNRSRVGLNHPVKELVYYIRHCGSGCALSVYNAHCFTHIARTHCLVTLLLQNGLVQLGQGSAVRQSNRLAVQRLVTQK